jgi:chaperone BCS1
LLFNSLPKRCILLLEDVDTAGLSRAPGSRRSGKQASKKRSSIGKDEQKKRDPPSDEDEDEEEEEEEIQASVTATGPTPNPPNAGPKEPTFKNTVTLSGLLNAIDGVASQEGRVLIMVSALL